MDGHVAQVTLAAHAERGLNLRRRVDEPHQASGFGVQLGHGGLPFCPRCRLHGRLLCEGLFGPGGFGFGDSGLFAAGAWCRGGEGGGGDGGGKEGRSGGSFGERRRGDEGPEEAAEAKDRSHGCFLFCTSDARDRNGS